MALVAVVIFPIVVAATLSGSATLAILVGLAFFFASVRHGEYFAERIF